MFQGKYLFLGLLFAVVLSGCGKESSEVEFGKSALYWYQKVGKGIAHEQLDKADSAFVSLKSEHMHSPFIPKAMLLLAKGHMDNEEYLLANYYLDAYAKRYGATQADETIAFLKLKALFFSVKDVYKDQKLIMDTIAKASSYRLRYPNSEYLSLVNTMLIRLQMSQYLLNENIAALYERTGKKKAAKIYRAKNKGSVVELKDITPPKKDWIGKIFD